MTLNKKEIEEVASLITEAINVLYNAPCGAIGENGATMEELEEVWNKGQSYDDDAVYDTCQHAYRILEKAIKIIERKTKK